METEIVAHRGSPMKAPVKRNPRSKPLDIEQMTNMRIMEMAKFMADWQTGISEFESPSLQLYYDGVMKRYVRQITRFLRSRDFLIIDKDEMRTLTKAKTKGGR